jgi:lysine-specific demethylase 8
MSAWFGPGGTISPLHTDPRDNLFGQVLGSKYIRLYSPKETSRLYPHDESMLANSSQVEAENPDLSKFPLFADATYVDCVVGPGDMLFIPV